MKSSWLIAASLAASAALLSSACNDSLPPNVTDAFALDCPGVTEHAAHVEGFLVVGHRGAGGKEVENTIPSMVRAVQDGANAVEIDLSMTKDGFVVLWHDWDPDSEIAIARATGAESNSFARPRYADVGSEWRKKTDELTLGDLRAHYGYSVDGKPVAAEIPTIEQFLDWAMSEPRLDHVFFDVKVPKDRAPLTEGMIQHVLTAMRERGASFQFAMMSPYEEVWSRMDRVITGDQLSFDADPGIVVVRDGSCEDASSTHAARRGRGYASTVKPMGWSSESWKTLKALLTCDLEARDRSTTASGTPVPKKVVAATIDDRDKMECLVDLGVDGLLSDDPGLLREVAVQHGRTIAGGGSVPATPTSR